MGFLNNQLLTGGSKKIIYHIYNLGNCLDWKLKMSMATAKLLGRMGELVQLEGWCFIVPNWVLYDSIMNKCMTLNRKPKIYFTT